MVTTALYTGLSGLRAHQTYIDVIGNNLANVSTAGFRGSRATFSDLMSFTVRSGSAPIGTLGGENPYQIGTGTLMSTIDTNTNQGTLQDTGRSLDLALQGRGFFTLTDGNQNFYSRVGSFGIDANRNLVDLRNGMRVVDSTGGVISVPATDTLAAQPTSRIAFQGNLPATVTGPLAEVVEGGSGLKAGNPAAKTATAGGASAPLFDLTAFAGRSVLVSVNGGAQQTITFPSATFGGAPVPASTVAAAFTVAGLQVGANDAAGTIQFGTVRLGASASLKFDDGPQANGLLQAMGLNAQLVSGTESTAVSTTDLAGLTARLTAYTAGDQIAVSGTNPDGSVFSDTFVYGAANDGTTLADLVAFINSTIDPAQGTAELTADGKIRLSADQKGEATLSLFLGDATGNAGKTSWPSFVVSQQGTDADSATTSIDVIDSMGRTHPVTLTFTRDLVDQDVWSMVATTEDPTATITQGSIGQIRFNDDGSFNVIGGGSNTLQFQWTGITAAQDVRIELGTSGTFDGVAQLGNNATIAAVDQDGYLAGTLLNVGFDTDGRLVGYYSNGQNSSIAQLRVTMFTNEAGLQRVGDTLFAGSPNSDDPIATTANAAGAGTVRAGKLENSNVDISREFVNLIEAQRGFQANSRIITTTDEILAELMNIVR
ncbi:MAG: flagellar hook-basal body complex protein [Planctomycetota bacterium]